MVEILRTHKLGLKNLADGRNYARQYKSVQSWTEWLKYKMDWIMSCVSLQIEYQENSKIYPTLEYVDRAEIAKFRKPKIPNSGKAVDNDYKPTFYLNKVSAASRSLKPNEKHQM